MPSKKSSTKLSEVYNTEKFEETDYSKIKKYVGAYKRKTISKLKEPKTYVNYLFERVPILRWLPKYKLKEYLLPDILSGLTVGIMNIPQGMAYSILAALPAVNGLYISFFPCIFYSIFGTSRHLSVGSFALVSLLTGNVIQRMTEEYKVTLNAADVEAGLYERDINSYKVQVAASLTLLVGIIQVALGLSGLGVLTSYFSDTFISSYTFGAAFHIIRSQVKNLFGFEAKKFSGYFNVPKSFIEILTQLPNSNWQTICLSVFCITYLVIFKEYINPWIKKKIKFAFPSELLLVVVTTAFSYLVKLDDYGVKTVGEIPSGFPLPMLPKLSLWGELFEEAFIIAIIAFCVNASMAFLFARKHSYTVDSTQELLAYGITNTLSSFFQCFPSAASLSRSSVLEGSGGKTNVGPFFSALILLFVILFMGPLFEMLPKAVLASIIVAAFKTLLLQYKDFFRLWKINKFESISWLVTFLSVVILDVDIGLLIGVGFSIFTMIVKDQLFHVKTLANYEDSTNFVDDGFIKSVSLANLPTTVKIFKIQGSLYFANCAYLQDKLTKHLGFPNMLKNKSEAPDSQKDKVQDSFKLETIEDSKTDLVEYYLLLDFSSVNYIDTNGVKTVIQLVEDFKKKKVNVLICEPQERTIERLYHMKLLKKIENIIFVTVNDALLNIPDDRKIRF